MDTDTQFNLIAGAVGDGLATKFMAHRRVSSKMPNPTDILFGKVTELKTKEISAMYSLTISLCYELKDAIDNKRVDNKQFHQMADNFLTYMMNNFETELVILGAKIALKTYKLPFQPSMMKSFEDFRLKFGKYILEAS
jgi:hypothetical protein